MKKNVHPQYQKVLFVDSASGHKFVCGSTLRPEAKEVFEGVEYPVSYLSISSSSHPFFTGSRQLVDSEGRVEKFKKRFERKREVAKEDQSDDQQQQASSEKEAAAEQKPNKKAAEKPAKATKSAAKKK